MSLKKNNSKGQKSIIIILTVRGENTFYRTDGVSQWIGIKYILWCSSSLVAKKMCLTMLNVIELLNQVLK